MSNTDDNLMNESDRIVRVNALKTAVGVSKEDLARFNNPKFTWKDYWEIATPYYDEMGQKYKFSVNGGGGRKGHKKSHKKSHKGRKH